VLQARNLVGKQKSTIICSDRDTHRSKTVNKNITKKNVLRLLFALFEFIVFLKVIRSAFKLKALSYPDHLFILKVDG